MTDASAVTTPPATPPPQSGSAATGTDSRSRAKISSAIQFSMFVKSDGTLWGCGASEVGDESTNSRKDFIKNF